MGQFGWAFKKIKKSNTFNTPSPIEKLLLPIRFFVKIASPFQAKYNTSPHFWARNMGQIVVLLGEYIACIYWLHVAPFYSLRVEF
jgi:hypothetical protein